MKVAGLLTSQSEAQEIQFVASINILRERLHYLIRKEKIKQLLKQENMTNKNQQRIKIKK